MATTTGWRIRSAASIAKRRLRLNHAGVPYYIAASPTAETPQIASCESPKEPKVPWADDEDDDVCEPDDKELYRKHVIAFLQGQLASGTPPRDPPEKVSLSEPFLILHQNDMSTP